MLNNLQMENSSFSKVDLFISRKSKDAGYTKKLYDFFKGQGLEVFESDHMLIQEGESDYPKAIRTALNSTKHFMVFASKAEYLNAPWIEYEWGYYESLKAMGKTTGKFLVILTSRVDIEDIPLTLQRTQVFYYENQKPFFRQLMNYLHETSPKYFRPVKPPVHRRQWFKLMMWAVVVFTITLAGILYFQSRIPFNMTVFLKPDAQLHLHPDYPKFKGGKFSIFIGDKEEFKEVTADGEVNFKKIPAEFRGKTVALKFQSDKWAVTTDSITLKNNTHLALVPDGSMATIKGMVFENGYPQSKLENAKITIGAGDTIFYTDKSGYFNVQLSPRLQQDSYRLYIEKNGYRSVTELYYPKSDRIDIPLIKN
jgi:TIR domain